MEQGYELSEDEKTLVRIWLEEAETKLSAVVQGCGGILDEEKMAAAREALKGIKGLGARLASAEPGFDWSAFMRGVGQAIEPLGTLLLWLITFPFRRAPGMA